MLLRSQLLGRAPAGHPAVLCMTRLDAQEDTSHDVRYAACMNCTGEA